MARVFWTVIPAVLCLSACSSEPEAKPEAKAPGGSASAAATSTGATQHGDTSKPGSHEDWCVEHDVPESKCTKCNPKLIPAFKATKDWCDEHQMPLSIDTKCDPNLKVVRPPKGT